MSNVKKTSNALGRAKANANAKKANATTETIVEGTVIEVKSEVKKKSNDALYRVAIVEIDQVKANGEKVRIAGNRTIEKFRDEDGELLVDEDGQEYSVKSAMVEVGQSVTLHCRLVTDEDGKRVMYADIQSGSATDNSDDDAIDALFGA